MRIVNVMEILVSDIINELMIQEKICDCPRCKLDIAAIALNNLQPNYIVTLEGEIYKSNLTQYRIDAMQMVLKAIKIVEKQPHH